MILKEDNIGYYLDKIKEKEKLMIDKSVFNRVLGELNFFE
jgi:hypothetical protein